MNKLKFFVLLIVLTIASAFTFQNPGSLKIKGSDTLLPLSQKEAEIYMKKNPSSKITVIGGGSGVGIAAFLDGTTDIAMSSRKIKIAEKIKLKEAGKAFKEVVIAHDALTVIVNPKNKVSKLTREQIEGIYIGKIKNWNELGGEDEKIIAYSRESSSGTFEFFKEHVLSNKNYASEVLMMPATGTIVQSVSQTKGAIGYIGLAYMENNIKAINISYDNGKSYVKPTFANAKSKKYPIVRPLYYYYLTKDQKLVKPFIDYVLSAEGQKTVVQEGYITI